MRGLGDTPRSFAYGIRRERNFGCGRTAVTARRTQVRAWRTRRAGLSGKGAAQCPGEQSGGRPRRVLPELEDRIAMCCGADPGAALPGWILRRHGSPASRLLTKGGRADRAEQDHADSMISVRDCGAQLTGRLEGSLRAATASSGPAVELRREEVRGRRRRGTRLASIAWPSSCCWWPSRWPPCWRRWS